MIDCVTISTSHFFRGNPICEQHRLRHECIVRRQGWNVPAIRNMEYDQYDNPAAYYLVWRDLEGKARGSSRLYPTDRPYMLEEVFPHLVTKAKIPKSAEIWEGSRFCVDESLSPQMRKRIVQELVHAVVPPRPGYLAQRRHPIRQRIVPGHDADLRQSFDFLADHAEPRPPDAAEPDSKHLVRISLAHVHLRPRL